MYTINEFMCVLEGFAPLELSIKQIENGAYDNSGIMVKSHDKINSVLFALDLSSATVERAKRLKVDTIVTHHPAIYAPIKNLSVSDATTAPIIKAIKYNMNVISMHLNLDVADGGIDQELCLALGAKNVKVLDYVDQTHGYGREFCGLMTLPKLKEQAQNVLGNKKIITYGNKATVFEKFASFCGGGSSHALDAIKNGKTDAQVIITSDMPHHVIKELVEMDKAIMIISHYSAENYGFNKFYERVKNKISVPAYYFDDKRFS